MKSLNNKVTVNGILNGTGWLPPVPDLRDYPEEHPVITDILVKRTRTPHTASRTPFIE